jgi:hypothetical protein
MQKKIPEAPLAGCPAFTKAGPQSQVCTAFLLGLWVMPEPAGGLALILRAIIFNEPTYDLHQ